MPEEPGLATSDVEADGFSSAVAAFAKDDEPVGVPNAVPEGDEPPAPAPEVAAEAETVPDAEAVAAEAEKPPEFVKFDKPEQQKRFNDMFGYAKRLERELETIRRQTAPAPPPQPAPQSVAPETQLQPFSEPRPRLGQFETIEQHEDAVERWEQRREKYLAHQVKQEIFQHQAQQQTQRQQREEVEQRERYEQGRMNEGRTKFGQEEFNSIAAEVSHFAPDPHSVMYTTLFGLQHFPEVVMHLGKNLVEADRISRLSAADQIYELKDLEKKLTAKAALATKTQPKLPNKVEAPGQGEDPKPASHSLSKLRQAAKASGSLQDYQKLFMADPTL